MRQDIKRGLHNYWLFQLAVLIATCIVFLLVSGTKSMGGVLTAGLVFMVPNMLFARSVFKHQGAQQAKKIVKSFYRGEGFKLVLSAALFVAVFATARVDALAFFVAYVVLLASQWVAHIFLVRKS